jgi:hypothetical protein
MGIELTDAERRKFQAWLWMQIATARMNARDPSLAGLKQVYEYRAAACRELIDMLGEDE